MWRFTTFAIENKSWQTPCAKQRCRMSKMKLNMVLLVSWERYEKFQEETEVDLQAVRTLKKWKWMTRHTTAGSRRGNTLLDIRDAPTCRKGRKNRPMLRQIHKRRPGNAKCRQIAREVLWSPTAGCVQTILKSSPQSHWNLPSHRHSLGRR